MPEVVSPKLGKLFLDASLAIAEWQRSVRHRLATSVFRLFKWLHFLPLCFTIGFRWPLLLLARPTLALYLRSGIRNRPMVGHIGSARCDLVHITDIITVFGTNP